MYWLTECFPCIVIAGLLFLIFHDQIGEFLDWTRRINER